MRNFKSTLVGMCLAVSSLGLTAFSALTASITIPTGLNPGDQYRIAFVTRTIRDGNVLEHRRLQCVRHCSRGRSD